MTMVNQHFFFGAPTRSQAKAIAWADIKALAKPVTISHSEGEMWVRLMTGSEIHVLGMDRPERVEGRPWHGGVLDEFGNMKFSAWNENLKPALTDTKGWCWFVGVPEGRNHYFELSEYARLSGDPEWADYCWFSADVLDPVEVEKERQRMDDRTFKQEYQGSFESYGGLAYTYHDKDRHRIERNFNSLLPVIVCCDFNLDPCIWLIGQDSSAFTYIDREIVQHRTDVWRMCVELKKQLRAFVGERAPQHKTYIYGDHNHGTARSLSTLATTTTWKIVEAEFKGWNVELRHKSNPRIIDRVNATNSRMRSADGTVRFGYSRKCVQLARDYDTVDLAMMSATDQGDRTHACSAVDYFMNLTYPVLTQPQWKAA